MRAEAGDLVAAIPLPAVLIQWDERIAATNIEAATLLGDGLAGRHFITALRQPALLDAIEGTFRDSAPRRTRYHATEDRQNASFDVSCRAVKLESGAGVLLCFQDVTHLEQAGQMRRDFVANVSHELRTPLTALLGFIETLQGPAREDAGARDRFLTIMQTEATRMERLVGDLLSLSRVEAEERVRPTEPVDLPGLLRSVLNGLAPLAAEAGVTLRPEFPETRLEVPADPDQLRQVVMNLVENAVKYSGRGASVTVRLSGPGYQPRLRVEGVEIAVTDTGPGFDPMHIPRLTERFYRVDNHRSREMGGTGLGLAIVKHIVNRHRGRLRIESEPGRGSSFCVILPLRA
ncbi:sensor histidine kinase [Salipiger marinus]|jgi:two-component system, OmpR family, phosphate regulon sensor histidine kinase PhoR|uniref:histidine kinase n=1 Tax=Salipiger marinus TaxID=555512 RepID=A0A1G8PRB0_9RHOB|nr:MULTISPECIES: ATP-binding protein [Salipiger]MCD1619428.1 two-component sensor histidine kinase [Salipiger manganoxidans]MEB3420262.1 ATP-binding protein [Salipiger manganoxidans]SDI94755.1 two-component system, OmpR family, phosphate regulon sensor histidine kinase PhoR [Salipiger marinus]HBM61344.1 two-component sensor histidine kinase [Citreicella sp.]|tara:strand:+ start:286 stop:1326 length:1041 start_codon:yes stop_codon:yes gene_type:complete